MKLLLLSNFEDVSHEHYLLNLTFCEGLQYFHLRKCNYSEDKMRRYLDKIPPAFHGRIILHSHFHLVQEYGLLGAHFKKDDTFESFAEQQGIDGNQKGFDRMGFSLHSTSEVMNVSELYDYVFLSPIFDSISNKGYNSRFKLSNLKNFLRTAANRPEVFALGGITHDKVEIAASLGFDGVVLLGYLWTDYEMYTDLIKAVEKFRRVQRLVDRHSSSVSPASEGQKLFIKS